MDLHLVAKPGKGVLRLLARAVAPAGVQGWGLLRVYLVRVDGLAALAAPGGGLWIQRNAALTDLSAFQAFTSVGGTLQITDNTCLDVVEAEALRDAIGEAHIAGEVTISGNDGPCL